MLLTFDDCYVDLLDVAAPALAARGIEAVAFAVTGLATATNEWDHRLGRTRLALLDADGLRALAREGVEIGAHSRTHRALPEVPGAELVAETAGSAEDVAALALPLPRFFAYPYGEEDGATRAAVRAAGYLAGFGLAARRFVRGMDPMAMPRVEVLRQDDGLVFRLKTRWPRLAALL